MNAKLKVLIVGGTSSLGIALRRSFSEFSEVLTAGRVNCDITLDLNDPVGSILFPQDMDVVIHTAAHFGGNEDKDILDAENINALGTLKICQAAYKAKAKHVIIISSIFSSLKEASGNYNIYALSKRHAEEIGSFYCAARSLPLTILRPSQIYGNGEGFRKHQPFFYTIMDKAEKGEDLSLYGSNDPRRNYIHIDDLTAVIVNVVKQKVEGIWSCAFPNDVTYSQIAKAAFMAFNTNGKVLFLTEKADIPDNIFEKDDSLYQKIGFSPAISIEEGIKELAYQRTLKK